MASDLPDLVVPAGKLFHTTTGEYSDYGIDGDFLALQDITKEVLLWVKDRVVPEENARRLIAGETPIDTDNDWEIDRAVMGGFIPTLIRHGYAMVIDSVELHLGSYGQFNLV